MHYRRSFSSHLPSFPLANIIFSMRETFSKYGVISGPGFPVFGLNTGKYEPEISPYLDTFHAVILADSNKVSLIKIRL